MLDAIRFLAESRALLVYAICPGCEDYAVVDDLWQRNLEELQRRLGRVQAPDALKQKVEDAAAPLLLMLLEPGQRDRWHEQAEAAATKGLMQCPWYHGACAEIGMAALQPARDWLRVAGAPLADEELATQRAADIRAKAEERRQANELSAVPEEDPEGARAAELRAKKEQANAAKLAAQRARLTAERRTLQEQITGLPDSYNKIWEWLALLRSRFCRSSRLRHRSDDAL